MANSFFNVRNGINLGAQASDPSGGRAGDFYYNSTSNKIRWYNGTAWADVGSGGGGNITVDSFNGTGAQLNFTLSVDPGGENNTQVYIEGVYQEKDTYSVSGTTLTFSTAPPTPTGTSNIEVVSGTTVSMILPNTTKGDLAGYSTLAARVPVGTDGKVLTADSTAALGLSYQPAVARNYIINGNMTIAQRGTSFPSAADTTFGTDRFVYYKNGTMVHTITNTTADVPTYAQSGYNFTNSLNLLITTADTSIASGEYCMLRYNIEGFDYKNLHSKAVTLSFWVKNSIIGIYSVGFRNSARTRSYVAEYTVNVANTWEKKTITLTLDNTGTWLFDNGKGMEIDWSISQGSSVQTSTLNTWQSAGYNASTNQVNGCNTGGNFYITGVMLNEGSIAMPFQTAGANHADELAMCERYYNTLRGFTGSGSGTTIVVISPNLSTSMRTNPTITAPAGAINMTGYTQSSFAYTTFGWSGNSGEVKLLNFTGITQNASYYNNIEGSGTYLAFSAEL